MYTKNHLFIRILTGISFFIFLGCSEVSSPDSESLQAENISLAAAYENELEYLKDNGIPLDSSKGIFSLDWRQLFIPGNDTTLIAGNAMAVAFSDNVGQGPPFLPAGIDIGSVSVIYPQNQVKLNKHTHPHGGISYSLFMRPNRRSGKGNGGNEIRNRLGGGPGGRHRIPPAGPSDPGLPFFAGESYQFEITGSANFSQISFELIIPPALIEITSHVNFAVIDPEEDLTLSWNGGYSDEKTAIRILPKLPGGPGNRYHGGQNPLPPRQGIFVLLEDNPGTYTVQSSDIQELLNNTAGLEGIICHVEQMRAKEVVHPNGNLHAIVRTMDSISLNIQ